MVLIAVFNQFLRLHRSTMYIDAACCYRRISVVCWSVMIVSEPCKTADHDAILVVNSGGPKEACVRWGGHVVTTW